ncbi:hypothetical protein Tco_1564247 [Tanacetum coccineum]
MTATVQTPSQILLTRSLDYPDGIASNPDAVSTFCKQIFKPSLCKVAILSGLADGTKSYPVGIVRNVEESKDMIDKKIEWNKPSKEGDCAWHIKIEMIDPDAEKFDIVFQSIPTTRKLSEKEKPSDITNLEHFYDA